MNASNKQWPIIILILGVAVLFRFQNLGMVPPGFLYEQWMRPAAALAGVLTVLGLYLFSRKLFNWQIAAIASFLLAVSFWHTLASRSGNLVVFAPLVVTWGLFFLWRALATMHMWNFAVSGIFWGLGFYTFDGFRLMPLVLILTVLAYWWKTEKDFEHEKYKNILHEIGRGLALLMVVGVIIALPFGSYQYLYPQDFWTLSMPDSWFHLTNNLDAVLSMFTLGGNTEPGFSLPQIPLLPLTAGIFFLIGFIRSIIKLLSIKKHHGHFSVPHTLTVSWFLIGLLPLVFSTNPSSALGAIIVTPVVYLFAAEGLWWIYNFFEDWQKASHHKASFASGFAVILLLFATAVIEYKKYFIDWALQ